MFISYFLYLYVSEYLGCLQNSLGCHGITCIEHEGTVVSLKTVILLSLDTYPEVKLSHHRTYLSFFRKFHTVFCNGQNHVVRVFRKFEHIKD